MSTSERRKAILATLYKRKHEKIANLAEEFSVSSRTIRRDIVMLSLSEPIYTVQGRYYGGVYIVEDSALRLGFFNKEQTNLLKKILKCQKNQKRYVLSCEEYSILSGILKTYSMPEIK